MLNTINYGKILCFSSQAQKDFFLFDEYLFFSYPVTFKKASPSWSDRAIHYDTAKVAHIVALERTCRTCSNKRMIFYVACHLVMCTYRIHLTMLLNFFNWRVFCLSFDLLRQNRIKKRLKTVLNNHK